MTGVDTVGICFPIRYADPQGATMVIANAGTPAQADTYRRQLAGGGFMAWGIGDVVWAEASLPKRVNPDNIEALSAPDAVEALRALYHEVAELVEVDHSDHVRSGAQPTPGDPFGPIYVAPLVPAPLVRHRSWETASVKRLDCVRDFDGVHSVSPLLNGLSTIRQGGRSKVRRYADSDRGNAETLTVGPKAWSCTLYDKHAETGGVADPGRVRFEARLRSDKLLSKFAHKFAAPIATIRDITPENIHMTTEAHFRHVGFHRQVSGTGQFAAVINDCPDLSAREKRELVGYLAGRAMGIDLQFSSNTERKYRTMAANLGLVLSGEQLDDTFTARLDFDAGTQLLGVAA